MFNPGCKNDFSIVTKLDREEKKELLSGYLVKRFIAGKGLKYVRNFVITYKTDA